MRVVAEFRQSQRADEYALIGKTVSIGINIGAIHGFALKDDQSKVRKLTGVFQRACYGAKRGYSGTEHGDSFIAYPVRESQQVAFMCKIYRVIGCTV